MHEKCTHAQGKGVPNSGPIPLPKGFVLRRGKYILVVYMNVVGGRAGNMHQKVY